MPGASSTDTNGNTATKSSPKDDVNALKDLLVAYAKQETVVPLKSLIRFVIWGVIGALLLGIACILWVLAIVRTIQNETRPAMGHHGTAWGVAFTGHLTWLPYLGGLLFAVIVAGLAVSRISKGKAK